MTSGTPEQAASRAWRNIERKLDAREPVFLDGAIGTALHDRGVPKTDELLLPWSVGGLVWHPNVLLDLHIDYIRAGCDVITINSFRTDRSGLSTEIRKQLSLYIDRAEPHLPKVGANDLRQELEVISGRWSDLSDVLTRLALFYARFARMIAGAEDRVAIAASMTTKHDCYEPKEAPSREEAYEYHATRIEELEGIGAIDEIDLFLIETINTVDEARGAVEAVLEKTSKPVWVSFVLDRELNSQGVARLARGTKSDYHAEKPEVPALEAARKIMDVEVNGRGVGAVLFNCSTIPATTAAIKSLKEAEFEAPVGGYPNAQLHYPWTDDWKRAPFLSATAFAVAMAEWQKDGAVILGGCCGTLPKDIEHMKRQLEPTSNRLDPEVIEVEVLPGGSRNPA